MYSIAMYGGTRRPSSWLRWVTALAYVLWAVSGVVFLFSERVGDIYGWPGLVTSLFLFLGGALSAYGAIFLEWVGEFLGLPLLASSLTVLGALVARYRFIGGEPWLALGDLVLLVGVAAYISVRFRVVLAAYHADPCRPRVTGRDDG